MQLAIEIAQRPNMQVRSHAGSTKSAVTFCGTRAKRHGERRGGWESSLQVGGRDRPLRSNPGAEMQRGFIGENDHQVIVTVRAGIPARSGAKEVNPFGAIHIH